MLRLSSLFLPVFLVAFSFVTLLTAQPPSSSTTVTALVEFSRFYHGKSVTVRGPVTVTSGSQLVLSDPLSGRQVRLARAGQVISEGERQIRGTFLDVGRLPEIDDPRLEDVLRDLGDPFGRTRPKPGELLVLMVTSVAPAEPFPAPSVRAIALDPGRYVDQRVTVRGQFRGRNLYGDLPAAPAVSRWDFVLGSADAAVWVTNLRPRGKGFDLDVNARVDTNRWLEVSGTARRRGGLVWIDGETVTLATAVSEPAAPQPPPPSPGPPAKVIFSLPTPDETDVSRTMPVRLQFSRDLNPATIKGRVRVSYLLQETIERGEPAPPPIEFETAYDRATRVLQITFTAPLDRFRTLVVQILEGMTTTDGAPVEPYTLRFVLGG